MANSNTSLNGYEFGRSPRTTAPFWGDGSEGASIDDTGVYTDKTWSSQKISDELAEKADVADLAVYAKTTAVYTKAQTYSRDEVDELLSHIEPTVDAYTKTETDALLQTKAAVTSVYTKSQTYSKSEVDALISDIPAIDAYTKTQTDNLLADKADKSDTYTKTQVDNLIPDVSGLATKSELNSGLATKADESELASYAKTTSVYTKSQTYTKAEVDDLISGVTPTPVDAYTKAQTDNLLADKADASSVYTKTQTDNLLANKANASSVYTKTQTNNLLANKANSSDVYSKSQTYNKTEVDNLISGGGGGLQEYVYTIASPSSTTIAHAIMAALAAAITNVGIDNLEKLHKIVARTQWTYGRTPKVKEYIYDVKYMRISMGTYEDITLVAIGGDDITSTGDTIKFTKIIANTDDAHLIIVEQSGNNPVVTFTDRSTTNVDANSSPWYHKELLPASVSNLAYKLVFIYG